MELSTPSFNMASLVQAYNPEIRNFNGAPGSIPKRRKTSQDQPQNKTQFVPIDVISIVDDEGNLLHPKPISIPTPKINGDNQGTAEAVLARPFANSS